MKKIYSLLIAMSLIVPTMNAGISLAGRAKVNSVLRSKTRLVADRNSHQLKAIKNSDVVLSIVETDSDEALDNLETLGCQVRSHSDGYAIVIIPADVIVEASSIAGVKRISPARKLYKKIDTARNVAGVNSVHNGTGLSKSYDGTGVVVGIMDTGVEANHEAFKSGSISRIKGISEFVGTPEYPSGNAQENIPAYKKTVYSTAGQIEGFTTDKEADTHGTHVLGILAGGYTGNSYYGVAKNSDIYVSCGDTYDANILEGIEDIAKYAKRVGKPCVINMSLGSNLGPHDGTDSFDKSLAKIVKNYDVPICVAAGNEGSDKMSIIKTMTATNNTFQTMVMDYEYVGGKGNYIAGGIDIWGDSSEPFTVQMGIYNISTGKMVYNMPAVSASTYGAYQYVSSSDYAQTGDYTPAIMNTAFPDGYFGLASEVDPANKRYEVYIDLSAIHAANYRNDKANNYRITIKVTGKAGQKISAYCDNYSVLLSDEGVSGYISGNGDGSISNESCTEGVISVGSWNSRNSYKDISGRSWEYQDVTLNQISSFSSYGTTHAGQKLPHLCAPGAAVISSVSKYYVDYLVDSGVIGESGLVQYAAKTSSGDYWGVEMGTSMSAPFVAGVLALCKQAYPGLTAEDAKNAVVSTAKTDTYTRAASAKSGAGKVDALASLKKAIEFAGVENVIESNKPSILVESPSNGQIRVLAAGENEFDVVIYNLAGQEVKRVQGFNGEAVADVANNGVFVAKVIGQKNSSTTKIVVK